MQVFTTIELNSNVVLIRILDATQLLSIVQTLGNLKVHNNFRVMPEAMIDFYSAV